MTKDIVLVTVDSLRGDHCGWLSEADLTPSLDELAEDSLTFTSAVSPGPRTFSSVPVTHTGKPLAVTEQSVDGDEDRIRRMKSHLERFETVAEGLKKEGYTTVAFTANPWISPKVGFDVGFDKFAEVGKEGGDIHALFQGTRLARPAWLLDHWVYNDSFFAQWRTFYEDMLDTLDGIDGPVFLWVFLIEPHNPYLVPRVDRDDSSTYGMYAGLLRGNKMRTTGDVESSIRDLPEGKTLRRLKDAYRDCVRSADAFIERLTADFGDDSVLIFHSDHGEAFGEQGTFGHQSVLYEVNIHVPLLVHGTDETGVIDAPISTRKIPEIARQIARGDTIDIHTLTSEYVVARTLDDSKVAVRGNRWKYIRTRNKERLYDLEGPHETADVSGEYPSILSDLREQCDTMLNQLTTETASSDGVETDEKMKEHLRSLGYLE